MLSRHGEDILIVNGYKMRFHKILKNDVKPSSWVKNTCKSYTKTNNSRGDIIIEYNLNHNQEIEPERNMLRQVTRNSVKRKAREELCAQLG